MWTQTPQLRCRPDPGICRQPWQLCGHPGLPGAGSGTGTGTGIGMGTGTGTGTATVSSPESPTPQPPCSDGAETHIPTCSRPESCPIGGRKQNALFPGRFSMSSADNNITVFPAVGWEKPAAFGGIDPIDPRGSMSFPGDLLKKLLMSLFHFHQLITSCCCSLHLSSTCRNETVHSPPPDPKLDTFSTIKGCWWSWRLKVGDASPEVRSPPLPRRRHTQTLLSFIFFFKGQPSSRLSNWSPGLTFKLRPL